MFNQDTGLLGRETAALLSPSPLEPSADESATHKGLLICNITLDEGWHPPFDLEFPKSFLLAACAARAREVDSSSYFLLKTLLSDARMFRHVRCVRSPEGAASLQYFRLLKVIVDLS